jgi:hypothetical protein
MMTEYSRENYYYAVNELIEVITGRYRNGLKAIRAGDDTPYGDNW